MFFMWSVFLIKSQFSILSPCGAHQYPIDHSKSSLVFIVGTKNHLSPRIWNEIQLYTKLIVDEFAKQHSAIVNEYRFIQNGSCYVVSIIEFSENLQDLLILLSQRSTGVRSKISKNKSEFLLAIQDIHMNSNARTGCPNTLAVLNQQMQIVFLNAYFYIFTDILNENEHAETVLHLTQMRAAKVRFFSHSIQ